jgi:tetratricopeptide (TPR) repeat protein
LLKWVGGATAILSLVFAVQQFIRPFGDVRDERRQVAELYKVGKAQQDAGDYASAWASFEQAAKHAEAGGQFAKLIGSLNREQRMSRQAEEDLAMAWLEDVRAPEGKTFSEIVDKLVPVVTRAAAGASGVRKGDLLGHLGWAYFLKARDTSSRLDEPVRVTIERHYREALAADPGNPYAHAHWGHLIFWSGQNPDDARSHFSAAVASGRAVPYVRRIQLAALWDADDRGLFLEAVNDMVKNRENVTGRTVDRVRGVYYFAVDDAEKFRRLAARVPPTEQITMIRRLFYDGKVEPKEDATLEASLAMLQEAAGVRDEALQTWLRMRSWLPSDSVWRGRADASIARLSEK